MSTPELLTSQEEKAKLWAAADESDGKPVVAAVAPEPVTEQAAAPTESAPAEQAGAEPGADDPFAGWTETAKHEVLGLRSQLEQITSRLRNAEGHIGGLNSQLKQQLARATPTPTETPAAVPTQAQIREAVGDPKAMKRLKEDYPDLGPNLDEAIEERISRLRAEMKAEAEALAAARTVPAANPDVVTREELTAHIADLTVETQHKGWKQTVKTPAFAGWLQTQPREVQMLAGSSDVSDAIRLLDLHKEASLRASQNRNQRQASAAAIPMGRSGQIRAKPVEQMTREELWQHLDAIEAQKA